MGINSQGQLFHRPGFTLVTPSFPVKSYLYAFLLVELKIVLSCLIHSFYKYVQNLSNHIYPLYYQVNSMSTLGLIMAFGCT